MSDGDAGDASDESRESGMPSTPERRRIVATSTRVSPYPERLRTPTRINGSTPTDAPHRQDHQSPHSPLQPSEQFISNSVPHDGVAREQRYRLIVHPLVKRTVNQRENNAVSLDDFIASGASFNHIIERLWNQYSSHIKGIATKDGDVWSLRPAEFASWRKAMAFKTGRQPIPSSRDEASWNSWVNKVQGETVTLLIYQYGSNISTNQNYDEFKAACIAPQQTDRAGAAAEIVVAEVIEQLQQHWRGTLQSSGIGWRLWANHVTSTLDRTTWEAAIRTRPPDHLTRMFSASDSRVQQRNTALRQSARLALDTVDASLADFRLLKNDLESYQRRVADIERSLTSRKRLIEGMLDDLQPPPPVEVDSALDGMENVDDVEHQ